MLIGIHIYNYRVLHDVRLGVCRDALRSLPEGGPGFPLRALTVLVGENRSGKSTLIEALAYIRTLILHGLKESEHMAPKPVAEVRTFGQEAAPAFEVNVLSPKLRAVLCYRLELAECDGEDVVKHEVLERFPLTQALLDAIDWDEVVPTSDEAASKECFRRTSEGNVFRDGGIAATVKTHKTAFQNWDFLKTCPEAYALHEYFQKVSFLHLPGGDGEDAHISGFNTSETRVTLKADGRNLRSYLEALRSADIGTYRRIDNKLMRVLNLGGDAQILHWLGRLTEAERKLAVIIIFLQARTPCSLLGIENPDYGLFPDRVDELARELRSYAIRNPDAQVILTTSHMNLLESLAPREVWTFSHRAGGPECPCPGPDEVPEICVRCAASDPLVTAMYEEGVGLGTLLYGGYLA